MSQTFIEDFLKMSVLKLSTACEALTEIIESKNSDMKTLAIAMEAMDKIDPEGHSPWSKRIKEAVAN